MAGMSVKTREKSHISNIHDIPENNKEIMSQFTKGLFWSYDIDKLDYVNNKDLIIEQVIEAGLEKDEILMWKLYSYEDIKRVALQIAYLEPIKLNYISFVLKINEEKFRCYGKKPWYLECFKP